MKHVYFVSMLLLTIFRLTATGQTITIGTGTSNSDNSPIQRANNYSASELLFLSSEVNTSGSLTGLGFNKASGVSTVTIDSVYIYVKTTASTSLTTSSSTAGYTLAYQGPFPNNVSSGWVTINFNMISGFNYSTAAGNLSILLVRPYMASTTSRPYYYYTTITGSANNAWYKDDLAAWSGTMNGVSPWRPNTKLIFTAATVCATPTVPTATSITATTASLNWTQTGTPINYQIKYGAPGFNVSTAGTSIFTTTKPYTLNPPLAAVTSYDYYVRAICSAGDTSAWSVVKNFTTLSSCSAPTAPTATSITTTSAVLNWTQAGTPINYQIKYGAPSFNVTTGGTSIFTTTKPYTLNPPLTVSTSYDYYVRAICSATDTSAWSPVTTFTTLCNAPSVVSKKDSFNCGTGVVNLEATTTTGASIKWYAASTGGTALATGNTFTTPSLTTTTTYYITAIQGTCESSPRQAVIATIRPIPTVNIGHDTTICPGISYTFDAGNAGGTYLWSPGGATTQTISTNAAGQYIVQVTVNKCVNKDTLLVTPGLDPVNNLPASTNLCAGDTATLNAGNAGSTYIWSPGGAITQTIKAINGGTYSVQIKSADGCKITSNTTLIIRPLPVANLDNDTSICNGSIITLDAGNPGYSFSWNTGANSQSINVTDSGKYIITVTSPYNCVIVDSEHISFLSSPRTEGFSFIPQFFDQLGKVSFIPLNPTNVDSYEWDFGDNTPHVTQMNPTHVYAASGFYNVTLKVYNDCTDFSLSQDINVDLTTGIVTVNKKDINLMVYPNPAKSVLNISNKSPDYKMEDVMVFNSIGALVYHHKADSPVGHQLSVEGFANGIYFVRILTDKGFVNQQVQVTK